MSTKSEALVREIAALFVKYSLKDWEPVMAELERGNRRALAEAVRDLSLSAASDVATARAAAKAKLKAKAKTKPRTGAKVPTKTAAAAPPPQPALDPFSPARAKILEPLRAALREKAIFPGTPELKALYLGIGIKTEFPKRREDAVEAIVRHLDRMAGDRYDNALTLLGSQAGADPRTADDYARWFDIILHKPSHG